MAKNKVVILIVEGISDERALSSITKYVKEIFDIHIHFANGDIFSKRIDARKGIKGAIGDEIQKVMNERKYLPEHILAVIQVADTDGTFIDDKLVVVDKSINVNTLYLDEVIKVCNQNGAINIKQRNKDKASRLKTMFTTNKIKSFPYYLLYFSCNLDHVIHDEQNLEDEKKTQKAREFNRKFKGKPNDFLEFFKENQFVVDGTIKETWEFIQSENNSLKKFSNFHLIFNILDMLLKDPKLGAK
ncbi:hypothetical protein [Bacillus mycoides]|uniref:hypothetical protein n=1 Tax=Bacillus mycoides TaxID=1405 RepID=UPI00292F241C|nr:hypothetical protein [Bacillus mycoides]WOA60675.1 hypothetical protein RVY74_30565 [Bacillus mycoides]